MKEIVLDIETTGLSIKEGHRVVEIGCMELENLIPTKKNFHCYINPERKVSDKAFKIHGYSDDFLSKQKKFIEVKEEFLKFIRIKHWLFITLSLSHLNNELGLLGFDKIDNEVIDTLTLARDKFPGSRHKLDALCKRFRIDNSKRVRHTALIDCELLSKVYINLIDQKETTLNFNDNDNSSNLDNNYNVSYFKKIIDPTDIELKKHKEYLKTSLKKNYFN